MPIPTVCQIALVASLLCSLVVQAESPLKALEKASSQIKKAQARDFDAASLEPLDRAVRDAPSEVIAARTIQDAGVRISYSTGSESIATVDAVRAATSLLDAEPSVRNFHDKLKALSAPPEGAQDTPENVRIYQGVVVNGYKRVVALLDQNGTPRCTGTLLSPRYVLTATHCLCDKNTRTASAHALRFVASGTDMVSADIVGELDPAKARWMGSGSICYGDLTDPDVAVVGFSTQKALGIPPLGLATDDEIDAAEALRVVGYGSATPDAGSMGIKRAALVPVVSPNCVGEATSTPGREFSSVFECVRGREVLAGRFGGADTCAGDSGGPAFVAKIDSAEDVFPDDIPIQQLRLAAVTSRGIKTVAASRLPNCGYGGIYVRISTPVRDFLGAFIFGPTP